VKVLSRRFRAKFASLLKHAFYQAKLTFHGKLQPLAKHRNFLSWLNQSTRNEWMVYAKPPFGGPQQVLRYLARYTHRVAISNRRLVALHNGSVTFRWKDYAKQNQPALMTLDAAEFIRRFLLHVLPKGLVRVRHFGFLANRCRRQKILLCRRLLDIALPIKSHGPNPADDSPAAAPKAQPTVRCPVCKVGCLRPIGRLLPQVPMVVRYVVRLVPALPETNTS
jgi:putative transposase